jgi:hypothetical protein
MDEDSVSADPTPIAIQAVVVSDGGDVEEMDGRNWEAGA